MNNDDDDEVDNEFVNFVINMANYFIYLLRFYLNYAIHPVEKYQFQ